MKTKVPVGYICVGCLDLASACSLIGTSISVSPHRSMLVDSVYLLAEYVSPLGPIILPSHSSTVLPELCLVLVCITS